MGGKEKKKREQKNRALLQTCEPGCKNKYLNWNRNTVSLTFLGPGPALYSKFPGTSRKPFEYHALGGQSFRIPSTGKYTIEKVKPSQGQPQLERTTKTFTHSSIPVSFYPLNNTGKLKKMPEKTKNYFNLPSIFLDPPYNFF